MTATDEDRAAALRIVNEWLNICGERLPSIRFEQSEALQACIAQALADAREEAEAQAHYHCGKRITEQNTELARLRAGQLTMQEDLEAMREERDRLREAVKDGLHHLNRYIDEHGARAGAMADKHNMEEALRS